MAAWIFLLYSHSEIFKWTIILHFYTPSRSKRIAFQSTYNKVWSDTHTQCTRVLKTHLKYCPQDQISNENVWIMYKIVCLGKKKISQNRLNYGKLCNQSALMDSSHKTMKHIITIEQSIWFASSQNWAEYAFSCTNSIWTATFICSSHSPLHD